MSTVDQSSGVQRRERRKGVGTENRRLFSSSTAMILGRLITAVFGWAGSVIIARTLTGDDWGRYSFVFALLGIMEVVTDLGVGRVVLARLTSDKPEEVSRLAGSFIMLRTALGILGYLIALGYAYFAGLAPLVVAAAGLAGTTVALATPANALFVLYQSKLRLTYVAVWDIIGQAVQFLLIVAVAAVHPALLAFIIPAIVREIVVFAARAAGVPKLFTPEFRPSFRAVTAYWGEMLREALPISVGFALFTLLERIDMLMLQQLGTYEAVGVYAIGYKFSDLMGLIVSALAVPFTTVLIKTWPEQPGVFRARLHQAVAVAALLGGLGAVVFWPSAEALISLLYGTQFAGGAAAAALLVVGSALSGLTFVVVSALVAARKLRVFPWIAAAGLLLNVGLNLVLIPLWSIDGAAIATVATEVVMLAAMLLLLRGSLGIPGVSPWGLLIRQALVATAVAASAVLLVSEVGIPWPVVVLVAVTVHVTVSALTERRASAAVLAQVRSILGG